MSILAALATEVWVPSVVALVGTVATSVFALVQARLSGRTSRTQQALDALTRVVDEVQEQRDHEVEDWSGRVEAVHGDFARERERTSAHVTSLRADLDATKEALAVAEAHFKRCDEELRELRELDGRLSADVESLKAQVRFLRSASDGST